MTDTTTPENENEIENENRTADDNANTILELKESIVTKNAELTLLRTRQGIHEAIANENCVDVSITRLLVEEAINSGAATNINEAIATLKTSKPFLFNRPVLTRPHGAAAPKSSTSVPAVIERAARQLETSAEEARVSGRPADLMRYLRLRRNT